MRRLTVKGTYCVDCVSNRPIAYPCAPYRSRQQLLYELLVLQLTSDSPARVVGVTLDAAVVPFEHHSAWA